VPRTIIAVIAAALGFASCAGPALRPAVVPAAASRDALLILPGFGYGRDQANGFKAAAAKATADGIDFYVAKYVTRRGLDSSRRELHAFIREQHLDRYERVHVFAFIAGAWTLNPASVHDMLPNLTSVVYDRSPYQERAPTIAVEALPLPAWLRYGSTIFDVARTPYPPLTAANVRIGLLVETQPTAFIRHHAQDAIAAGPFDARCAVFQQRYDDCAYVAMRHDELYSRFVDIWPDVEAFTRDGRFTAQAARIAPSPAALSAALR
jgi:hypothetical protein